MPLSLWEQFGEESGTDDSQSFMYDPMIEIEKE